MKPLQTRNTMDKGTVLPGFGKLKPVPVPEHTRDLIVMVLPIPVSYLMYPSHMYTDQGMYISI